VALARVEEQGLGRNRLGPFQFDRLQLARVGHQPADRLLGNTNVVFQELTAIVGSERLAVGQHDDLRRPGAQRHGQARRFVGWPAIGGERPAAVLPAVAVGTVMDADAVALSYAGKRRQLVAHAGGQQEFAATLNTSGFGGDAKARRKGMLAALFDAVRGDGDVPDELHAIAGDLPAARCEQICRRGAVASQVAVHFAGGGVSGRPSSITSTRRQLRPSKSAALSPAGPPPMMITSYMANLLRERREQIASRRLPPTGEASALFSPAAL
jgi:hypothetical protein